MTTIVDLKRNFWLCLTAVWHRALADPENGIGLHKIPFFETIVKNAGEDERNGSTSYFADEPIGNQQSILRSAPYILEGRISLGCSLLFPGKKSYLHQGFRFPYVVKDAMEKSKEALSGSDEGELSDNSAKGDNHVEPIRSPAPILPPFRKNLSKAWNSRLVPIRSL